ncbi:MAG TPA: SDR family NAD(P)-dependent oxidoreductase [Acidimicrobiales bacterium]
MGELRFDGRSVIVTGGGRGFGRCHALLLASRGARVVVADYGVEVDGTGSSPEPAEQVVKEIEAAGGEAVACFADVAVPADAERIVQTAVDAFGGVDVLVNNAGIWAGDWFDGLPLEQFGRMVEVHYLGTVNTCKAAWPHLKEAQNGCIVNTSSEAVIGMVPKNPDYAGAKGAVFAFTKALALNGQQFGVRVNAIAPRGNTRMSAPEILAFTMDAPVENFRNEFFDNMKPEYVSPAVGFLAHESCTLTGEVLMCGGKEAKRLALIETQGLTFTDDPTPEDLANNVEKLMDPTDPMIMTINVWG